MKAEESQADMMKTDVPSTARAAAAQASPAGKTDEGPPCAAKVEKTLDIPTNALLSKVEVSIVAMPAGECPLKDTGETRLSQDDTKKAVIDLKRMRSVSGLKAPQTIEKINAWTGAEFGGSNISANNKNALFSEVATERLLVTFTTAANIDTLIDTGTIILPDAPADLVLSVNDKTAWTHIGPVKLSSPDNQSPGGTVSLDEKAKKRLITSLLNALNDIMSGGHTEKEFFKILEEYGITISAKEKDAFILALQNTSKSKLKLTEQAIESWLASQGVTWEGQNKITSPSFTETVDITKLLQDEINAGASSLKIVLRSALACRLQLTIPSPQYLLSHDVVFPAQALALEINEEGKTILSLPLPPASSSWLTSKIFFTMEGDAGKSRFFPAVGPQALSLGELVLDSDHALAASLDAASLSSFKNLEGVRLPLLVEKGGAEVTAFLRLDDNKKVGDYLADAAFQSITIEETAEEKWVQLELSKPVDIQTGKDLWLEINVIRGKCWWQLGGKSGESAGVVNLQRGIPGGSFSIFRVTLNGQAKNLQGRLRLKGQPVTDGAIHAIIPLDPQSGEELQGITTGSAPLDVELQFNNAIRPSNGKLNVPMLFHAPGTYTVTEARVIYEN